VRGQYRTEVGQEEALSEADRVRLQRLRHDLRQPLSTVMLLVAASEHDSTLSADVRQRLRQVRAEVEWMGELLASTEDEDEPLQRVDLGDAVESACRATSEATSAEVLFSADDGLEVLVDPVQLRRSVRNLVANAVRAVGDGGRVEVRVRRSGYAGVVEIADSGPGFGRIAPQQGLGLMTVRRFVDRTGGSIAVGTAPLGGALVSMRIPLVLQDVWATHGDSA